MNFFPALKNSITSTQFYSNLHAVPFRESVFFWLKFYLSLLVVMFIPVFASGFVAQQLVKTYYPYDLKIIYKDGQLQTEGLTLPFTFHVSDTTVTFASSEMTINSADNQTGTYKYTEVLTDVPAFTVTKDDAGKFIPTVLPIFLAIFAVAFVIFLSLMRIPLMFLYAFVIRSVLNIFGKQAGYIELLQMSIHATVVAEIINLLCLAIYRNRMFPMFDVAFFGIMILALRSRRVQIVRIG